MNAELIGGAIFVVTVIFAAGKFVNSATEGSKKELAQLKLDVNRLGSKLRDGDRANLRKHFNSSLMMVASEDDRETRFRIAGQLREDG